jgi:hypothetical protein
MAYILATARLETKKLNKKLKQYIFFAPTTEGGDVAYFNKYDPVLAETAHHRQRAVRYGNTQQGDGYKYRGRGYVQVTWKLNYKSVGDYIGQDLVTNPDLGLNPRIAAFAAVYGMEKGIFTGRKLSSYITDQAQDYLHAKGNNQRLRSSSPYRILCR